MANDLFKDQDAQRILQRLVSREKQGGWAEFLETYSRLIYQVIRLTENEPDYISDCFLFICEKLSERKFRRLRHFRFDGRARFTTWLWAVARNLSSDWRRRESGRHRISRSIARLRDTDRAVFRCVYEQGMTREHAFHWLAARNPALQREQVDESCERIHAILTPRQLWLLSTRQREYESLETGPEATPGSPGLQVPDPAPNPEAATALKERQESLEKAFRQLSKPERLLITLRYEQNLTLQEIANLLDLKDPWVVERRIKQVLDTLRKQMTSFEGLRAKTHGASV